MKTNTFLRRTIFLASLTILLLTVTASAASDDSITISSPSNDTTFEHGEQVRVYVQTTNSSMTKPMLQTSDNLGTWDPMNQIDDNLFVKNWNTSQLDNNNSSYIISAKTSLFDKDYYDSINIEIEKTDESYNSDSGSDTDSNLGNLTVDGLKDDRPYEINKSRWIQVMDEDTNEVVPDPHVKIYNPGLINTFKGTESGLVKIKWTNLDKEKLDPGKYLVSITADDYKKEEYLVDLVESEDDEEDDENELDVMGLERKVVVNSHTDIWVFDDQSGDPVEDATIKVVDKKSGTVVRSEKTTDQGEVYWLWDIKGYFTVTVSKQGYDTVTRSVRVVPESAIGSYSDDEETSSDISSSSEDSNSGSSNNNDDSKSDLTLAEVQRYLRTNHKIDGEPYRIMSPQEIDRIEKSSYQRGYQNATQSTEDEGPIAGLIISNPTLAIIGLIAIGGVSFAGGAKVGKNGAKLNIKNPSSLIPNSLGQDQDDELTLNNNEVPDIQIPHNPKDGTSKKQNDSDNEQSQDQEQNEETASKQSGDGQNTAFDRILENLSPEQKQELLESLDNTNQSDQENTESKGSDIPEEPAPEEFENQNQNKPQPAPKQPFDTSEYDEIAKKMNQNKGGGKK